MVYFGHATEHFAHVVQLEGMQAGNYNDFQLTYVQMGSDMIQDIQVKTGGSDAATPMGSLALAFGTMLLLTLAEATRHRHALERVVQHQREHAARIAGVLDAARRIQMAMLPRAELLAAEPRVDLAAAMLPAREVGGDLYHSSRSTRGDCSSSSATSPARACRRASSWP